MSDVEKVKLNDDTFDVSDTLARERIGDLDSLDTTDKSSVVGAVNEVKGVADGVNDDLAALRAIVDDHTDDIVHIVAEIGVMNDLDTTDKSSLVNAINEVKTGSDGNESDIGNLSDLDTTDKSSLVAAINEVKATGSGSDSRIGDLSDLDTTDKSSVVAAINEVNTGVSDVDTKVGDLSDLDTTDKSSVVAAINEAVSSGSDSRIGDLSDLDTTDKSSVVAAINEVNTDVSDVDAKVGDLSDLDTTDKSSVVAAINEVDLHADYNATSIGTLSNLSTTDKSNLVAAINEVKSASSGDVGDLSTLTTTAKSSAVAAINELDGEIGDLSTLKTTAKSTLVAASNELKDDLGKKSELNTSDKTSLVKAINEVNNLTQGSVIEIATVTDTGTSCGNSLFTFANSMDEASLRASFIIWDNVTLKFNSYATIGGITIIKYTGYEQTPNSFTSHAIILRSDNFSHITSYSVDDTPSSTFTSHDNDTVTLKLCKQIGMTANNTIEVASVVGDGVKTTKTLLNELYAKIINSGVNLTGKSYLARISPDELYKEFVQFTLLESGNLVFGGCYIALNTSTSYTVGYVLNASDSYFYHNGNNSNQIIPVGAKISVYL